MNAEVLKVFLEHLEFSVVFTVLFVYFLATRSSYSDWAFWRISEKRKFKVENTHEKSAPKLANF